MLIASSKSSRLISGSAETFTLVDLPFAPRTEKYATKSLAAAYFCAAWIKAVLGATPVFIVNTSSFVFESTFTSVPFGTIWSKSSFALLVSFLLCSCVEGCLLFSTLKEFAALRFSE